MTSHIERCDAVTDTIREHQRKTGVRDLKTHCICGWVSTGANGPGEHIRHQAERVLRMLTDGRTGGRP
jgi:hypothetical protein